jgi:glycogen operon protein
MSTVDFSLLNGNNNAYCQDNENNWFDWTLLSKHADLHRFMRLLIARRLMRNVEHERRRLTLDQWLREANKVWHGVKLEHPNWSQVSYSLALSAELTREGLRFHLILNAYWESLEFELPLVSDGREAWHRWIDTALDSPHDIVEWQTAPPVAGRTYHAEPHSVVMLVGGSGLTASTISGSLPHSPYLWL